MDLSVALALFVAETVNAAMPGPCVVLIINRTVRAGWRGGARVMAGVALAMPILVAVALAVTIGALTLSQTVFTAMKWAGIAVLLALAARMLASGRAAAAGRLRGVAENTSGRDFTAGLLAALSSPFNLVFFLALLPQFVPVDGIDARAAGLILAVILAGSIAGQSGALLLGLWSRGFIGARAQLIDYVGAATMIVMAAAAIGAPVR